MTFAELRTLTRREIVVDAYEDAYLDEELNDVLWNASVEIAAAFDLPRRHATVDVEPDAVRFEAPDDCARIETLSIDGFDAAPADMTLIVRMRPGRARPVRYFNFDPRRAEGIEIAPPSPGGRASLTYTALLARPTPDAFDEAEPWDGVLSRFHPIIAYRAAVALFQMEERENETDHWLREYQMRAQELAAFLGRTDAASLVIEPERRNDEGAEG